MIERTPWLNAACHLVLVAAALVTCLPVYYAVVAGSLSAEAVQQVPPPLLPGASSSRMRRRCGRASASAVCC